MTRKTTYELVKEEDRRAKISITRQLNQLTDIVDELEKRGPKLGAGDSSYIGAMRLRADIAMNLLKKRLPDLKAIEHSGNMSMSHRDMTQADLAMKLTAAGLDPDMVIAELRPSALN